LGVQTCSTAPSSDFTEDVRDCPIQSGGLGNDLFHAVFERPHESSTSADLSHLLLEGRLHAAGAELVEPQRRLVLQGRAARVERVRRVVVEQAADGRHVEVGEAAQAAGEVGGVVARPEDAAELRVEQVLGHQPAPPQKIRIRISFIAFVFANIECTFGKLDNIRIE